MFTNEQKVTFPISSGLLDPKHYEDIGPALWEFLWLIDRVTEDVVESDGERWGQVLGGKPIKAEEIAACFGNHPETVKKNLRRLKDKGYIREKRLPRGKAIDVRKSIKWLKRFHGASTTSPSNQVAELVHKLRSIPGVVAQDRDFGAIGKLCKEFGFDKVSDALEKLQQAIEKPNAKVDNPLTYLGGILKPKPLKPFNQGNQADGEPCPKCKGAGSYIGQVPFRNGSGMKDEVIQCDCKKRKPAWAERLGVAT